MSEALTKESFDPHLNSVFEIHADGMEPVSMKLLSVTGKTTEVFESFSLIFCGPQGKPQEQGNHKVKHPEMGEFRFFMVPVLGGSKDEIQYQVVFNRLLDNQP